MRRVLLTVRIAQSGVDEIRKLAMDGGVDQSTMVRTLLAEAIEARRKRQR